MAGNKIISWVLCIVFSVLATLKGLSQGAVTGVITDENGAPAAKVTIGVQHTGSFTLSGADGRYLLQLPAGKHQLSGSMVGYETQHATVTISEQDTIIQNFRLKKSDRERLEEVKVEGLSKKRVIETSGFAVNVVETQKAALQSIQTNELLDRSAGVRIRQDGGLGSHTHYNINGMTGNAVKIFIGGVPSANYGQSFSLNSIPPALIERIEVYKGVLPSSLSDDALGGAINIVMKQNKRNMLNVAYSAGSFNTHQFNMNGSYRGQKGFISDVSGFYNYSDNNYEVWGQDVNFTDYNGTVTHNQRGRRFHDAFRSYGAKFDLGWNGVKWADRFTVGGVFSRDYNEMQHGVTMQRVFGDRHSRRNANIATLTYSKQDLLLEGLSLNVNASYSFLETQVIDTVGIMYDWRGPILFPDGTPRRYASGAELGNRQTAVINSDHTLVVRTNLGYRINEYNSVHLNYLFNDFERGISDEFLPVALQLLQDTRDLRKSIASFTYENLSFSNRLRTNAFYKYYYQKVTANEPYQVSSNPPQYGVRSFDRVEDYHGYGVAMSFSLLPKIYLLGSAERAIRFPNEREIFGSPADAVNPSDVRAEQSFNANMGVNFGKYEFSDNHFLRVNASLFYRDTKGMIRDAITPGNSGTLYFENLEDVMTRGFDAEIIYDHADRFNFTFNISKFDVLFNTRFNKKGEEYLYYRQQIRNEPSFKFNGNAAYYLDDLFVENSRASVHYNMAYVKGFRRNWSNVGLNNLDNIPTQFANDIGFVFTFPSRRITLSVDAKNIFNRQLYDNFGLQKPGRAFYGKINYSILK